MAILTVGTGKQYATIAAATAAAKPGDTVAVQAGTYVNDYATVKASITLTAVGGPVTMLNTAAAPNAPALLTVLADATVNGFIFSGMRDAAGNGAGILQQGGNLVVQNSLFTGNQDGILTTASATATLTIQGSEFSHNGNNDGFSHNVSAGAIQSLTITGSYIHDALGGDEVRSLAATTTITGTRIEDNAGNAAYAVDAVNGGVVALQGNVIEKGAGSTTAAAIRFGSGTLAAGSSLSISGNTLVSDKPGASLLLNQTGITASLASNTTFGFATMASGPASTFANVVAPTRPATSAATLVAGGLAAGVNFGRTGAVIASGHVLTVGAGQQYATLAAAVAVSADGDTIKVLAGTYVNDFATITHKVVIQGVGGLARFVDTIAPSNGLAQFVTTTDVTFQNIEIFGAGASTGAAAAILDQGGNLTIDNSTIHNNQAGVVATAAAGAVSGSVGIFDSEIAGNGTPNIQGNSQGTNVRVAEIASLTLQNDYIHDAVAGSEVVSAADNTTLAGDRIAQAAGNAAAVVSLPDGGLVSITGSAIAKAASATAAPVVQVGTGTAYAGSLVTLSGDVLLSAVSAAPTTFVADAAASILTTVSSTAFQGGTAGSVQVSGGTDSGASTVTGLAVATASPWGSTAPPAPAPLTVAAQTVASQTVAAPVVAQPGQLVLFVSETAFQGNAQFTLMVDGAPVAGTLTATASHAAGQSQSFTIAGAFAPGAHTVSVTFNNSLGSGSTGRALFVDGMSFDGQAVGQTASLAANGTALLETGPVTTPAQVTINLSEDAFHGDALAFISIDGKVMGGVQAVTAAHAAGQTQSIGFLVDLAPGAHTVAATVLNGVAGAAGSARNLYVDSVDVAGAHYAAAAAAIGAAGSSTFAFTVAPPAAANGALFVTSGLPQPVTTLLPHV